MGRYSGASNHALVEGCLEGNQDAWNELYRRNYRLVRSVVMRKLRYCRDE